ncbi:30S ribosomal protein S5 [Candidatus Woesearchaeota archaeon]|nr:30S ribosomal protein S5 [Candidatus Woesearchaeota archaeon]
MKEEKYYQGEAIEEVIVEKQIAPVIAESAEKKSTEDVLSLWKPRTALGRDVKEGKITDIDDILDKNIPILEPEIIDTLLPGCESDLLLIGQAKGKFGGGQRRVFRQTQKKTAEGNKPNFATCAVIGNKNGYVGVGYGKSKETVPARDKAGRKAKLNLKRIRRGCGSWECGCKVPHSLPYAVEGKCGSIRLKLIPAPKGKGLIAQREVQKILRLAGVQDVWSRISGNARKTLNVVYACVDALNKLVETKVKEEYKEKLGLCEGAVKNG